MATSRGSFFGYRNSPSRDRWDEAADALGFAAAHRRSSRAMGGTIDSNSVEVVDMAESPLIMFIDIDDDSGLNLPQFVVQMQVEDEPRQTGQRRVDTGDLTFEHQLVTFGTKPHRVLNYLNLQRRDILLELQAKVLIDSITQEGLRATLELVEWDAEDLVTVVTEAAEIVTRFYEPQSELALPKRP